MNKIIKDLIILFLAAFCLAMGVSFFLAPNEIAAGGTTGIAIIIKSYAPNANLGILMMIMDIILYSIGFLLIGPVFSLRTMYCSFSTSIITMILMRFFPINQPLSTDVLMQLIFGIALCSIGMGIAFSRDASTGGLDIVVKILNKYFHTSMALGVLIVDTIIIIFAISTFGMEKGLYAMFGVIMLCISIKFIMQELSTIKRTILLSNSYKEINEYIIENFKIKPTIYEAQCGMTKNQKTVLIVNLNKTQIFKLKKYILNQNLEVIFTFHNIEETYIGKCA